MKNAIRKRGPAPNPFHITIGKMVDTLQLPHHMVCELLHVSPKTLKNWLENPEKAPHRLMQIGAVDVLGAKIAYMRKGQTAREWLITTSDGKTHRTPELTDWLAQRYPEEHITNVAANLSHTGKHVRLGLVARKIIYTLKPDAEQTQPQGNL